jgi:hypothetical protein
MWLRPPLSPYPEDFRTLRCPHLYNNPEIPTDRQPPRRDPRIVPISAYTRSASRQGSVQQCCHRSGDELANIIERLLLIYVLPLFTKAFPSTSLHNHKTLTHWQYQRAYVGHTRYPYYLPSYQGSLPHVTY